MTSPSPGTEPLKPQLVMVRPTLNDLPALNLPDGYHLRPFRDGDEPAWQEVIGTAFGKNPQDMGFDRIMRSDAAFKPERVQFLCDETDTPAATAAAWVRMINGKPTAYVHYVGILPSHGGKKLGYAVSLAALHHMHHEGFSSVYLQTDDFRKAAVLTYLRLGFVPYLVDANQIDRWQQVLTALDPTGERTRQLTDHITGPVRPYDAQALS